MEERTVAVTKTIKTCLDPIFFLAVTPKGEGCKSFKIKWTHKKAEQTPCCHASGHYFHLCQHRPALNEKANRSYSTSPKGSQQAEQ